MSIRCFFGFHNYRLMRYFIPPKKNLFEIQGVSPEFILKLVHGFTIKEYTCSRCNKIKSEEFLGDRTHEFI